MEIDLPVETTPDADEGGLADHEAAFGRGGTGTVPDATSVSGESDEEPVSTPVVEERDDQGRFKHRASSQRAKPEDVPQINALTKDLREKEAALAKLKPEALSGSPRLRGLQRQIKAIEAELTDLTPKPVVTPPVQTSSPSAQRLSAPAAAFTDSEPAIEQFANATDQYAAWMRAVAAYDRKKERWEADQVERTVKETAAKAESAQQWKTTLSKHDTRVAAFAATRPDFQAVTEPVMTRSLPGPLLLAIIEDDNGPKFLYHLAQHPDVLDEMHLLTAGQPASEEFVAMVQRRLTKAITQAVPTGSAAGPRLHTPPRPPNPVRTGPMTTGDELPGDESTLAEHEHAFGPHRRR